ncbi:MAG: GWxTD domain-containing protein [Vicingaceae bacterium]
MAFHTFGENATANRLQSDFRFALPKGKLYPMEIRFRDQYRDLNVVYYLWLDKRENGNEQFYLMRDGKEVLIEHQANLSEQISLEKSPLMPDGLYEINYSNTSYSMTPPPFADAETERQKIEVDSSEQLIFVDNKVELNNWSKINQIIYRTDAKLLPFYFYDYYPAFPEISEFHQMIEPLRYITTSSEFKKLKNAVNVKQELDNFWLRIGGSAEKAEKMLRLYYKRVQMANEKFTSYKEGWKTDRGIIYIVYGQPTNIYKGISTETWVFGEENHILSIKFEFNRKADTMTNNRYELLRNPDFKNNWYRAVDQWRQGKTF